MNIQKSTIVVLIPCLNEEITIGKVIRDFQKSIPEAQIIVFDNNSTDRTASIAHESGAKVEKELRPGKGNVMASMFRKVEADYYVIVDGDDTYSAEHVQQLLEPVLDGSSEMSVAARLEEYTEKSFRPFHIFGNNLVRRLVNWIFRSNLTDVMSGYRACSRELVKAVPIFSSGFEVETEFTIRTLDYGFRIMEVRVPYRKRPEGSSSKLRTFHDGLRILAEIARIAKAYKPFTFFGGIGSVLIIMGVISGIWVILDYLEDEYVNKVPTAILSTGMMLLGFGSIGIGVMLNTINDRFRENLRLLHRKINNL